MTQANTPSPASSPATSLSNSPTSLPKAALFCAEGSANKEYHVEVVPGPAPDTYLVTTRHGPRGRATVLGSLTPDGPVDLAKATKLFEARVKRQMTKSPPYTMDESGVGYSYAPDAGRVSGWKAALLTPVSAEQLEQVLDSTRWVVSEKHFGERRAVEVTAGGVRGMNRKGLYVGVPDTWAPILSQLPAGTILDGEHVEDRLHIFDCVQLGQHDLRSLGYEDRYQAICVAMLGIRMPAGSHLLKAAPVSVIHATSDPSEKRALVRAVAERSGEGVVGRLASGPYEPGVTPGSVKFKFRESSTCIVTRHNPGLRSVGLAMLDAHGREVEVGNVTIPGKQPMPAVRSLAEVSYLHMYEGGSLYEPRFHMVRNDIDEADCTLTQVQRIKSKSSAATDADADEAEPPQRDRERG